MVLRWLCGYGCYRLLGCLCLGFGGWLVVAWMRFRCGCLLLSLGGWFDSGRWWLLVGLVYGAVCFWFVGW